MHASIYLWYKDQNIKVVSNFKILPSDTNIYDQGIQEFSKGNMLKARELFKKAKQNGDNIMKKRCDIMIDKLFDFV